MSLVATRLRLTSLQVGHWRASHLALGSTPCATAGGGVQWGTSAGHAAVSLSAHCTRMAAPTCAPFGARLVHSTAFCG
eukprot:3693953-Lingulodinium_polyedra.AAC.1